MRKNKSASGKGQADGSGNWKVGDSVNIGTLKGLIVTGLQHEGSLVQFTLKHPHTTKEYTFVPGGLRKTYEPPIAVTSSVVIAPNAAIDRARTILASRCRRDADSTLRAELQEVIALLSSESVAKQSPAMEAPQVGDVKPSGTAVTEERF